MHRRRRKRPRTTAGASSSSSLETNRQHPVANSNHKTSLQPQQQRTKKPTSSLSVSFLEDSDYCFADGLKVTPTDIPPRACLPVFLEERRSGQLWKKNKSQIATWQRRMLLHRGNTTSNSSRSNSSSMILKRTWRPYASRRIPFTRVGTPETEAVLALDRTATQMLSLGGGGSSFSDDDDDDDKNHLALTLRLYGTYIREICVVFENIDNFVEIISHRMENSILHMQASRVPRPSEPGKDALARQRPPLYL